MREKSAALLQLIPRIELAAKYIPLREAVWTIKAHLYIYTARCMKEIPGAYSRDATVMEKDREGKRETRSWYFLYMYRCVPIGDVNLYSVLESRIYIVFCFFYTDYWKTRVYLSLYT